MPTGIYKRNKEQIIRLREIMRLENIKRTGKKRIPFSDDWKNKISIATRGSKNPFFGQKHTPEVREKIRLSKQDKEKNKLAFLKAGPKISAALKGKKRPLDVRLKIGEALRGEKNWNWKGGTRTLNKIIHQSIDWKLWREDIFVRDNFRCQDCGIRRKQLYPHHIYPFADFPKLRFERWNGITLCEECHKKVRNRELEYSTLFCNKLGFGY